MIGARAFACIVTSALVLAGCASAPSGGPTGNDRPPRAGGGYYQNDGPPADPNVDISTVPDAVPKNEPLSRYGNPDSYVALGQTYYVLPSAAGFSQTGRASWYGRQFHGRRTSSGEPYNMFKMTAAHKRLPIPSYVRVTNLDTDKHVIVRVNDRGPFHDGRIIDLSYVAARRLGVVAHGSAPVRIETVTPASIRAQNKPPATQMASQPAPATAAASRGPSNGPSGSATPRAAPSAARAIPVANQSDAGVAHSGWYLQSGAFGEAANAARLRARLHDAGFDEVQIVHPETATGLYRVRVGPFANRRSRDFAREKLIRRGFAARDVTR